MKGLRANLANLIKAILNRKHIKVTHGSSDKEQNLCQGSGPPTQGLSSRPPLAFPSPWPLLKLAHTPPSRLRVVHGPLSPPTKLNSFFSFTSQHRCLSSSKASVTFQYGPGSHAVSPLSFLDFSTRGCCGVCHYGYGYTHITAPGEQQQYLLSLILS